MVALADKAISDGSMEAYNRLVTLDLDKSQSEEDIRMVRSELNRVVSAFGPFSPTRAGSIRLVVSDLNPNKSKEEELDEEDILPALQAEKTPLGRAKFARFLSSKGKVGSYRTAQIIVKLMEAETHLEAFKELRGAFRHVTGYKRPGQLDCKDIIKWWATNHEEFRIKGVAATSF